MGSQCHSLWAASAPAVLMELKGQIKNTRGWSRKRGARAEEGDGLPEPAALATPARAHVGMSMRVGESAQHLCTELRACQGDLGGGWVEGLT